VTVRPTVSPSLALTAAPTTTNYIIVLEAPAPSPRPLSGGQTLRLPANSRLVLSREWKLRGPCVGPIQLGKGCQAIAPGGGNPLSCRALPVSPIPSSSSAAVWGGPNMSATAAAAAGIVLTSPYLVVKPWVLSEGATYVLRALVGNEPQVRATSSVGCEPTAMSWMPSRLSYTPALTCIEHRDTYLPGYKRGARRSHWKHS
jgi:hypothetical protein